MPQNTNRKEGLAFEREFCQMLFDKGWWVHNLAQNAAGQPFDVIALKDYRAVAFDCKVCSQDNFKVSRIEENQWNAMKLWSERTNFVCAFILKMPDGKMFYLSYRRVSTLVEVYRVKTLNRKELEQYAIHVEDMIW